ncbi:MAG: 16S rRNA (adenine(1518)-N(6)/adenine(1519)-N(6))-dimethyltransferase RsmA [Elainellaceae cyanobacterium]
MNRPRKRFGQHWLKSDRILQRIVAAAELEESERVLEIGPGTGRLTQMLVQQATVIAVEVDRDLCRVLRQQFAAQPKFALIEHDILTLSDEAIAAPLGPPNKVVANIPYYITGPILERLLGTISQPAPRPYDALVLLVQKEVADRICAAPGSKTFGALSARLQYLAQCELVCPVPAKAFSPPPKVESAVIRLKPRPFSPAASDPAHLDRLLKQGFAAKRKMLRNNLSAVDRDRLLAALEQVGASPQARAEALSVDQWVRLSNDLIQDSTDLKK